MLKVFLVEDECVVREGLRECIDWARYGFEFCGDAPDGELALPQIRKLRPDILITDIKMPFMDGLALSKLVCAELPETKIILISGHNDFEFAQEAIEIGVEQYLLKPVTKSSLLKTLEDVSRKIDEEREQKAYLRRFQQEGREYEQYARRKFFEQVTSGSLRVSEIYEQAKKLQIDIDAEGYTVILLTLQSRGAAEYSQTLADRLEELIALLTHRADFAHTRIPFYSVAVDAAMGEAVVLHSGPVSRAVRASMSIPGIFMPVEIDGRMYVDGGVIERIPCRALREAGADVVIGVDVGYTGGYYDVSGMNAYEYINRSIDIMQWEMAKLRREDADVMLVPQVLFVRGHFDTKTAREVIEEGRRVAREALPEIRAALERAGVPLRG